jgi:RNA polymerase sigma-70 factor, ECF subfamily
VSVGEGGLTGGTTAERDRTADLFARYSSGIYRYCLGRLRSPEEAEDALQLTYLNAWRSLKKGFQPENARPWLFQIAANVCSSTLRQKLGRGKLELRDPDTLDELAARESDSSEALLGLTEALRELPERQRRALLLRDWRGLSYDEIATEMAVSDAAVETLLFRARRTVATTLAGGDWGRKVAASARALAVWPFGLLHLRSSASSGAGHLKAGLTIAAGAAAPLVAFGVLQAVGPGSHAAAPAPHADAPPAVAQPDLGRGVAGDLLRHVVAKPRAERTAAAVAVSHARHVKQVKSAHAASSPHSGGESSGHAHSPPPPPTTASAEPALSKTTLCHATHSAKNPGVMITVSAHALHGHRGDARGACS